MPTTYNGIGTHYYGKKNPSARRAACRSCRQVGVLESYDTRLWFVIVFIPVIPLGRKRIIDSCPSCSRHFAADAGKYEQARQLQTSGSLDRFRRDPSPHAALEVHAGLLAFHEHDQAAEFRASAMEKFPDDAGLRAGLAAHLDEVLEHAKAASLYESALALDPDLPEARVGVALRRMGSGETLDEARRLLDFLEAPGAGKLHPLGPLESLAYAYQSQGRHLEALALASALLRELPAIGQMHAFRSFVGKSERALRADESILPRRRHSLGGFLRNSGSSYPSWLHKTALGGLAVLLLAIGLGINNWYIMNHRTIRVVNATGEPVKVSVDDGPAVEFSDQGSLTVPEGHHRLKVTGAVDETHDVDLNADYFARWFSRPVWVLNPGGEAAFDEATITYSQQPQPSRNNLIIGRPFVSLPHVDYAFEAPPHSIKMKKNAGPVTKTAFNRVPLADRETFLELLPANRDAALRFVERRLRRNPDDYLLLGDYVQNLAMADPARVEAYLRSGLDRRPVSVAWHRAYQTIAEVKADANLIPQYDGYLASTPGDARLLYLRGRIEPDDARRQDFYRRSIEADARLPWPWLALGSRAGARAEWAESIRFLRKAMELGMDRELVEEPLHVARLASGEASALVDEYHREQMARPSDLKALLFLFDALAASGQGDKVEGQVQYWLGRNPEAAQSPLSLQLRTLGLYSAGKIDRAAEAARPARATGGASILAQSLLALGRSGEVADDKAFDKLGEDPWGALAVSLGLALDRRVEDATRWRERAADKFAAGYEELKAVAKLLRATDPPPVEDVERLTIDPSYKALTFAVLAGRFPDRGAVYDAEAAKFNVRRKPPYELVRRAITHSEPKAP